MRTRLQAWNRRATTASGTKAKWYISLAGAAHGLDEQQRYEARRVRLDVPNGSINGKGSQEGQQWYQLGAKVGQEAAAARVQKRWKNKETSWDQSRAGAGRPIGGGV